MLFVLLIHYIYIFICTIIFCAVLQGFYTIKTKKRMAIKHLMWVYILLLYLSLVYMRTGMGTLWQIGRYGTLIQIDRINLIPLFVPSTEFGIHIFDVLNVIMVMPLGFLLPLIWPSFRKVKKIAITGFFFSLAIELSQLLNGRITDINDLFMNTLGAVVGYGVFRLLFSNKKFQENPVYFKNEAIIYLVGSFMGMFLLYNTKLLGFGF